MTTITCPQDPHWRGYSQQCAPCLANFTYIVHLEEPGEEGWVSLSLLLMLLVFFIVVVVVVVHLEEPGEEGWVVEDKSIYT